MRVDHLQRRGRLAVGLPSGGRARRPRRGWPRIALLSALIAAAARPGAAWESDTTHAGLTEQAALASSLHERLRVQFGQDKGLFQQLIVPPADAPELFRVLRRVNPTHGYAPDGRGRMTALAWLVAGSAVADTPEAFAANHFYDPITRGGLSARSLHGLFAGVRHRLVASLWGGELERSGEPAPDWIFDPKNPLGLEGFRDQYAKAVSARTPGERSRALAGALVSAGAVMHVLEDMGSPSHVRDDLAAHLDRLGPDAGDAGSRFERIAALAYGRLGVPAPAKVIGERSLRAFFTAPDGSGLADRTSAAWFSENTLPRPLDLGGDPAADLRGGLGPSLVRSSPVPPASLDLQAAAAGRGRLENRAGVCLARYRVDSRRLTWFIDDACALEQVGAILPEVSGYAAGLLDTLFRGTLSLESEGGQLIVRAGAVDLGPGQVTVYWDDARGVRTRLAVGALKGSSAGQIAVRTGAPLDAARRVTALFRGLDRSGNPLLATGTAIYPIPAP